MDNASRRRLQKDKKPLPKKIAKTLKKINFDSYVGVHLKRANAMIAFGEKHDAVLYNEKPGTIALHGNLNVHGRSVPINCLYYYCYYHHHYRIRYDIVVAAVVVVAIVLR